MARMGYTLKVEQMKLLVIGHKVKIKKEVGMTPRILACVGEDCGQVVSDPARQGLCNWIWYI